MFSSVSSTAPRHPTNLIDCSLQFAKRSHGDASTATTAKRFTGRASCAASATSKGSPMTQDNRQRKCIHGDGNNPPGLAHENASTISDNADVDGLYRSRKSSWAGNASSECFSDTAFNWLCQSGLVSLVPRLLEARQPCPKPPGEAPAAAQRASSGQVPIHALDAPCKLLQSFPGAVRHVCRMKPVRPPFSGNHSAQSDPLSEANKQLFSHRSNGSLGRDALVNGNFLGCLPELPPGVLMVTPRATGGGYK